MKKVKKNTNAKVNVTTEFKSKAPKAAKKTASKKSASKVSKPAAVKAAKAKTPQAETPKLEAANVEAPKVGDPKLATEADFTSPSHPHLSDYRYYAMVDKDGRVVGRGFLARVDHALRRSWFALRNDEQTKLWETSKWAIREIDFERYQQLTLKYLKSENWPEFKSSRSKAA